MEYKKIGDICHSVKKSVKPIESQRYNLYSLPAFDNSKTPELIIGSDIKSSKLVVDGDTILFNKLNVKYKRVWNLHEVPPLSLASTEFIPLKTNEGINQDYLYYCLISETLTSQLHASRKGTSNSQQRIDQNILFSQFVPVPDYDVQTKIAQFLLNIDNKIKNNNEINDNLSTSYSSPFSSLGIRMSLISDRCIFSLSKYRIWSNNGDTKALNVSSSF